MQFLKVINVIKVNIIFKMFFIYIINLLNINIKGFLSYIKRKFKVNNIILLYINNNFNFFSYIINYKYNILLLYLFIFLLFKLIYFNVSIIALFN